MSRIGKQITTIPAGTTVTFTDGLLTVKGPKGELTKKFLPAVDVIIENSEISFSWLHFVHIFLPSVFNGI